MMLFDLVAVYNSTILYTRHLSSLIALFESSVLVKGNSCFVYELAGTGVNRSVQLRM